MCKEKKLVSVSVNQFERDRLSIVIYWPKLETHQNEADDVLFVFLHSSFLTFSVLCIKFVSKSCFHRNQIRVCACYLFAIRHVFPVTLLITATYAGWISPPPPPPSHTRRRIRDHLLVNYFV